VTRFYISRDREGIGLGRAACGRGGEQKRTGDGGE